MNRLIPILIILMISSSCKKEEPQPQEEITTDTTTLDLLPHLGSVTPFTGTEPVCAMTSYLGDFNDNGIPVGQKVADFTLYNKDGNAFNLENTLLQGKPVFTMTGSFTCPTFRAALYEFNQLINTYENDITFLVAYSVEAHPDVDISPYADTVWTTQTNANEGILYEQPDTYAERVSIVNDMLNAYTINCEVIIDSPCNEFWTVYGEAPNRAYLIDTAGVVQMSHGWFNYPYAISAIDDFLGQ